MLPFHHKKSSPGEEPGREERETRELHPAIVYKGPKLAQKEKVETKWQFIPNPIMYGAVDMSDMHSQFTEDIVTFGQIFLIIFHLSSFVHTIINVQ